MTDQLDGFLARRWHVESRFGKLADPLADRLMLDAAAILLWLDDKLPWYAALIIVLRDVILVGGYRLLMPRGVELEVSRLGKVATWLLYLSLGILLVVGHDTEWPLWLFWIGLGLALVAAGQYVLKARREVRRVKAVVMAGGEGTRLRPLTSNQPKPMVPIVGKPCMEHIIELLRSHGMDEIVVTLAFMPQAIRSYFGDGESLGLNIEYSVEELPLGTAGSVRLASAKLDDTFLVISGDALCDVDLGALVDRHKETGAAVTIGLKSVDNPLEFGIVVTDEDGKVERFLEKPSWGQVFSDTINTGIYVLEPEVLTPHPDRGAVRLLQGALPAAARDGPADLRPRDGGLLAGHRQPRPVPAGELRRARRERAPEHRGRPAARQRLDRRGRRHPRRRGDRGTGVHRQPLPDHP